LDDEQDEAEVAVPLPDVPEWDEKEMLGNEKEVLGFYLTSHPLEQYQQTLAAYCSHTVTQLPAQRHRSDVMVGGMIAAIKLAHTKNPRAGSTNTKYAMFDLEDMTGIVRCILWPEQYATSGELVEADKIITVRATVDRRPGSEETNLIVNEIVPIDDLPKRHARGVVMRIHEEDHDLKVLEQLREIVRGYPGNKGLTLLLCLADGWQARLDCNGYSVNLCAELRRRVDDLIGPGNFLLMTDTRPTAPASGNGRGNGRGKAYARG